jgi:hypothetical protein
VGQDHGAEWAKTTVSRQRAEEPVAVGKPAAIATKQVREVLEDDSPAEDDVAAWKNYGNVTGATNLGEHHLAAMLGSQHYGDHAIERFCALDGREVDTSRDTGRGAGLDYGDDLANESPRHMTSLKRCRCVRRATSLYYTSNGNGQ